MRPLYRGPDDVDYPSSHYREVSVWWKTGERMVPARRPYVRPLYNELVNVLSWAAHAASGDIDPYREGRPSARHYNDMVYAAHVMGHKVRRDDWEGWTSWERYMYYNGPTFGVARVC